MARIKHPHPQLGRISDRIGGIEFVDGYADVDLSDKPNLADAYAMHGYEIEPEVAETAAINPDAATGRSGDETLDSLTVPELKSLADEAGLPVKSSWKKDDLIEALASHLESILGTPAAEAELRKTGVNEAELSGAVAGAEALATAGSSED